MVSHPSPTWGNYFQYSSSWTSYRTFYRSVLPLLLWKATMVPWWKQDGCGAPVFARLYNADAQTNNAPSRTNHCLALTVPDRKHDLRYTHNDVIPEANHRRTTRQLRFYTNSPPYDSISVALDRIQDYGQPKRHPAFKKTHMTEGPFRIYIQKGLITDIWYLRSRCRTGLPVHLFIPLRWSV